MTGYYLAVDSGPAGTHVAVGPEGVSDLADITVRDYPGAGVEAAVRELLVEEAVDAADVVCALAVIEPATDEAARKALERQLRAVLGHGPVMFIDRVEATLRGHLEKAPEAEAVATAVLTVGDAGERPGLDLQAAEALAAADPECFERWAVHRLDGIVNDWDLVDQGIDGVVWHPGWNTWESTPLLVVVKAGDRYDARIVGDLAAAVEARGAAGGVLVCMTAPPPEVYEAARHAAASSHGQEGDSVPVVQVLTVPEVLDGRRPAGVAG